MFRSFRFWSREKLSRNVPHSFYMFSSGECTLKTQLATCAVEWVVSDQINVAGGLRIFTKDSYGSSWNSSILKMSPCVCVL